MVLQEGGLLDRCTIYATDLNEDMLAVARAGSYPLDRVRRFEDAYVAAGGRGSLSDHYSVVGRTARFSPELHRNVTWARHAPVLMLSVAKLTFDRNGQPNRHGWHDVGAAMAYLSLQATALGLFVHQMAGIDPDKARQTYQIPDTHEAVAGIAVGYHADPEKLSEELRQKELTRSTRKPQSEFVFAGKWGAPMKT